MFNVKISANIKKIFLLLFIIFAVSISVYFYQKHNKELTFYIPENFKKELPILIENEKIIEDNGKLFPITLTTTRPVSIQVGNKIKKIKISDLSKNHFIKIKVAYKDQAKYYQLQTLPNVFPELSVENKTKQKGYVLISFHGLKLVDPSYALILDMNGKIVYYRGNPQLNRSVFHLKRVTLPDGKIRYITHIQDDPGLDTSWVIGYHLIMDEKFNVLDKVTLLKTPKHKALLADEHDILMLDDGHYIVIGQDVKDTILKNGKTSQIVHNIIQEHQNGKVLLDWSAEDYPILQNSCYEKCPTSTQYNADYMHTNSVAIDPKDNNIIISSASGYYIMKIHRKTGEILWFLGGKNNQYNIPVDAEFIRQHDAHILYDNKLAIFDNHISSLYPEEKHYKDFYFKKGLARIVLLELDEINKKILSSKIIPLSFYAQYMGSAQELNNNRWFVGCGSSEECSAEMIDENQDVLWRIKAREPYKMYRAYYYEKLK